MNRRAFMLLAAGGALMAVSPGCARKMGIGEREKSGLLQVARLLYPHDDLQDEVYSEALEPLREVALSEPSLAEELRSGLEALDRAAGQDWLAASEDAQIEALESLEGGAFFRAMQGNVRSELYQHPAVWELIGYEGSSLEKGGYLSRGFDDIDWLPEE